MAKLTFTTTSAWEFTDDFGCASLGLAGVCGNSVKKVKKYDHDLRGVIFTGKYKNILDQISIFKNKVFVAIVLFGNVGGENGFIAEMQKYISCPIVGGGAAIDGETGKSGLITGGGDAAVFLITDDRFEYEVVTHCIHDEILGTVVLETSDPRTILTINGENAADFLSKKRAELGIKDTDFEHLTISDIRNVNAHLSCIDGVVKSGRDVQNTMLLRYVKHEAVYDRIRAFYDDENAIVFGCAGLSGLLDKPLDTNSLGLFLFGEVCTIDGIAEFGNLMLSKLIITKI